MKKILLSLSFALGLFSVQAASVSVTLLPNTMTNVLSVVGMARVTQVIVSSTTGTNTVALYDAPTNQTVFTIAAYTNTVSYATNNTGLYFYTNYFGVVTQITNFTLVDLTNNLVPATTNSYPNRITLSAGTGTSARADNVNYYFNQGIWATNINAQAGTAVVSITYQQ